MDIARPREETDMSGIPRAQQIYRHFKGDLYQIVTVAEHTETGEAMVVYQAMYGDFKIYVRPLEMFCSKVDKEKYPDIAQEYRFELLQSWNLENESSDGRQQEVRLAVDVKPVDEVIVVAESKSDEESMVIQASQEVEEIALDPMLLAFLDAETYAEKLSVLASMHHRITNDMITTMAIASDVEIEEGDLENRYTQLKNCLLTLDRYEITRLR